MDVNFSITGTTPNSASTAVVGVPAVFAAVAIDMPESIDVLGQLRGATGGTLDLYLQTSVDGGTTFVDYCHFAQIAAAASPFNVRFGASRHAQSSGLVTVGVGTTPLLAASTLVGGPFGDRMRLVAVAGAGTTAGAAITILMRVQGQQRYTTSV